MANPTYQSGFYAPGRGTALHPELWDGCVGAWNPGLGNTGLSLRDWSGNQNTGTLIGGPTWGVTDGRQALNFDGVDDYISMGSPANLRINGAVSVSAWVYPRSLNQLAIAAHATGASAYFNLLFSFGSNQRLSFWNNAGGPAVTAGSISALNQWHHFAAVRSVSGVELFVNGVTAGTGALSAVNGTAADEMAIGRFGSYPGYKSSSRTDDVRIYNRAVTLNEVRTLAQRPGIAYELAPRKTYFIQAATSTSQFYDVLSPLIFAGTN